MAKTSFAVQHQPEARCKADIHVFQGRGEKMRQVSSWTRGFYHYKQSNVRLVMRERKMRKLASHQLPKLVLERKDLRSSVRPEHTLCCLSPININIRWGPANVSRSLTTAHDHEVVFVIYVLRSACRAPDFREICYKPWGGTWKKLAWHEGDRTGR